MKTKINSLKIWEIALLISLCLALCAGLTAHADQEELASQIVRLHVIAESDSPEDQALKLKVRDRVLEIMAPALKDAEDIDEVKSIISENLPRLQRAAESTLNAEGHKASAKATLSVENYPLRVYDEFSLPPGDYLSLRIILGEGKGENWWCVIFPPLCSSAVEYDAAFSELSDKASKLIVTEEKEYILKFRIIELYERIRTALK